jgi:hypothetical protein
MLVPVAAFALAAACGGNASSAQPASVLVIDVAFVHHDITPSQKVYKVAKGRDVRISLYSTTADVVHVQGYDKTGTVPAGQMVQVEFTADKTGHFNVELQRSHVRLFQLQVS